ncbi:MAG: hypothetical protein DRN92_08990 [Thermoproteota archaeon]|nr:MAG: hypothetical protein DRN92_08990 [Candidatus Korarchaeota archaeon]
MLDENGLPAENKSGLVLLAVALWVFTSVLGFLEILTVRAIILRIYGHFAITYGFYSRELQGAQVLGMGTLVVMGILCLGVAIGCGEYHLKHFGQPQSWRLFSRTIAVEVAILVLALFI